MKTWFKFQAKADASGAEVSIFDEIGMWGVTAKDFISELKSHAGKAITVSINSPGGSVFDALAIYNALRSHGAEITVKVMGVAASAASLIAMAGNKIVMPENTFLMVHNPWAFAAGNADELRDFADTLDTIGSSLVKTYVARTGLPEQEVKDLLAAETWLTAEEAVAKGFADEIEPALKIAASFYADRLPENVKAAFGAADTGNGDDTGDDAVVDPDDSEGGINDTLADEIAKYAAGCGLADFAAAIALNAKVATLDDAKALIEQAREVRSLCALASKPEMAAKLIREGATLDEARAALCDAMAAEDDRTRTDNTRPANPVSHSKQSNGAAAWAKFFPPAEQRN